MLKFDMAAKLRQDFGKGAARTLRRSGRTPAVLYGPDTAPLALSLETKSFTRELLKVHGRNSVVSLEIEGDQDKPQRHVMVKELQKDPIQDTLVHADFYEISLDNPVVLTVPLKYVGVARGVDLGGELHILTNELHIKGLPLDLPDLVEADVTSLEIGGPALTCNDLNIPEQVTLLEEPGKVCATVIHPAAKVEVAPEGGPAK